MTPEQAAESMRQRAAEVAKQYSEDAARAIMQLPTLPRDSPFTMPETITTEEMKRRGGSGSQTS